MISKSILALGLALALAADAGVAAAPGDPHALCERLVPEDAYGWALVTYDPAADLNAASPAGTGGRVETWDVDVAVPFWALTTNGVSALAGAGVRWNRFDFSGLAYDPIDVYTLTAPVDLLYRGWPDWTLWANVTPGLFSDLDHITLDDDYRTMGSLYVGYDVSPDLHVAGGAFYDREFGADQVMPMGGVVWTVTPQWQLNLILPWPRVTYAPVRGVALFTDLTPAGGLWNFRDADTRGDYDLKLECWRWGNGVEWKLAEGAGMQLWAQAAAGVEFAREYEIRGEDGSRTMKAEADDAVFVRGGLLLR